MQWPQTSFVAPYSWSTFILEIGKYNFVLRRRSSKVKCKIIYSSEKQSHTAAACTNLTSTWKLGWDTRIVIGSGLSLMDIPSQYSGTPGSVHAMSLEPFYSSLFSDPCPQWHTCIADWFWYEKEGRAGSYKSAQVSFSVYEQRLYSIKRSSHF